MVEERGPRDMGPLYGLYQGIPLSEGPPSWGPPATDLGLHAPRCSSSARPRTRSWSRCASRSCTSWATTWASTRTASTSLGYGVSLLDAIASRRSLGRLRLDPVLRETVEELLAAAVSA